MENRRVLTGAVLLGLLALAALVSAYTTDPPTVAVVLLTLLGVAPLVAVGTWAAGRARRTALRVATTFAVLMAVLAIPPVLLPDVGAPTRVFFVLFIVTTVVAVALVSLEIGGRTKASSSKVSSWRTPLDPHR